MRGPDQDLHPISLRPPVGPFQPDGHFRTIAGALAVTGALVPPALLLKLFDRNRPGPLPIWWHKAIVRSLGVRVRVEGSRVATPALFIANHLSWLDIPVLGSRIPASFVAKSEVGGMPAIGMLARLQNTIYVERGRRHESARQADRIADRLEGGASVILFPEGTSGAGVHMLPFKSALFAMLDRPGLADIMVQPVSLAYTHLNRLPITRQRLSDIAWIGDAGFAGHALDCMRLGRIDAAIRFHAPVRRADFAGRKQLAAHCHAVIADGYRRMNRP